MMNWKWNKSIKAFIFALILIFSLPTIKVYAAGNPQDALNYGKELIREFYIENVNTSTLDAATDMDSLIKSLNDPYSTYFTEQQYNDFLGTINNSFSGIGIQVDKSAEGIKIVSVFDQTPAKAAGLMPGDIIVKADNHNLITLSSEEAIKYIKGPTGTFVDLQVKRNNSLLTFKVERKSIVLPTVDSMMLDNHIGYFKISSFGEKTGEEFAANLEKLGNSPDSYIIDLRNNGGGYMDVALDIAGYFLGNNVALKTQEKSGVISNYNSKEHKTLIDKPTVFLINKYSASASEILAAAVKDYKKATFIGEKTYGKGVAQNVFILPDNSYIKLTVLEFKSPLGNKINKVGVTPDMEVVDNPEKNIDSLKAAQILLSGVGKSSKTSINVGNTTFKIDLTLSKAKDNLNTFNYIATNKPLIVQKDTDRVEQPKATDIAKEEPTKEEQPKEPPAEVAYQSADTEGTSVSGYKPELFIGGILGITAVGLLALKVRKRNK